MLAYKALKEFLKEQKQFIRRLTDKGRKVRKANKRLLPRKLLPL
jgi:hypothetical protein